jgi:hypothetical protein
MNIFDQIHPISCPFSEYKKYSHFKLAYFVKYYRIIFCNFGFKVPKLLGLRVQEYPKL